MTGTLHRMSVESGKDTPEPKGALTHCQWCGVPLDPTDKVWECVARLGHYLVCDGCHEEAIIHLTHCP